MAEDNNNNQNDKKPIMKDNVVFFPFHRIKDLNKARAKIDPKTEKKVKQIQNQIYVQQCVDDLCTVIMRYLHEEKVQLQNPILMKDFKLVNESIKSMIARYVGNNHNLQKVVDKVVVAHNKKGKALFNFVIDYENLPLK